MDERERAVIRRNSGGVWGTATRNDDAGCDRAAQEALCGALVSVALVQHSGVVTRTDRGVNARLDVFRERGQRDAPGAATHALAGGASARRGSASIENQMSML